MPLPTTESIALGTLRLLDPACLIAQIAPLPRVLATPYLAHTHGHVSLEARAAVLNRVGPAVLLSAALGAGSHLCYLRFIASSTSWKAVFSWTGSICSP